MGSVPVKLARLGELGVERPAIDGSTTFDLSGVAADLDAALFAQDGVETVRGRLAAGELPAAGHPERLRIGPPMARPGAVICIGINDAAHAGEGRPVRALSLPTGRRSLRPAM